MKTRAITGFFFVIVMVASNLLGAYIFDAFYLLLSLFCLREFYGLAKKGGIKPALVAGMLNGLFIYVVFCLLSAQYSLPFNLPVEKLIFLLPVSIGAVFIQELFKKSGEPFTEIAFTFAGILFAAVPFSFFHAMGYIGGSFNYHYPLGFLVMLWANDTGAYLSGRSLGRRKLFERHSPKKTWEGFFGGMLIAMLAGWIWSRFYADLSWPLWVSIGALIAIFGTLGDLVESMLKRSLNVKDSGGILPGHGGLLDRFDGLLIAAPVVYAFLYWVSN